MSAATAKQVRVLDDIIRLVARAFYPDEYVVVLDGLVRLKRYIKDEELANLLNLNPGQVRQALAYLKSQHLVKSDEHQEVPSSEIDDNAQWKRQNHHVFYYIDYRHLIDVVKFKIAKIQASLSSEVQDQYYCPVCKKQFAALQIGTLRMAANGGFLCDRCSQSEIVEAPDNARQGSSQRGNFRQQLAPISEKLKQTEGMEIPYFDRTDRDNFVKQHMIKLEKLGGGTGGGTGGGGTRAAGGTGGGKRSADDWDDEPHLQVNLLSPDDENITAIGERKRARNQKQDHAITRRKPPVPWMSAAAAVAAAEHRAALAALQKELISGKPGEAAREWNKRFYDELRRQLELLEDAALAVGTPADQQDGLALEQNDQLPLITGLDVPEPHVHVAGQSVQLHLVNDAARDRMTADEYIAYFQAAAAYYGTCVERVRHRLEQGDATPTS